jgi:site-specific DNA recombinase
MGGPVGLGYQVRDRKLVVDEVEAEQVRHIMRRYLELRNVPALVTELERQGYRTKVQQRSSGPHKGGCIYCRGTLYHLLSNRIYRGFIVHKGNAYPGEHEPIVDEELWDAVQARLAANAAGSSRRLKQQHPSLLTGKVYDGVGRSMTPSHATKSSRRYRYYVTRTDQLDGTRAWRVSAHDLEQLICCRLAEQLTQRQFIASVLGKVAAEELQGALDSAGMSAATLHSGTGQDRAELLSQLVERIDLREDRIDLVLDGDGLRRLVGSCNPPACEIPIISIDAVRVRRGHQLRLIVPGPESVRAKPARRNDKLVALVAEAQRARALVFEKPGRSIAGIAQDQGRCRARLTKLVALSCLAPDIVTAIVEGKQPEHLTANRLMDMALPLSWAEQRAVLGFSRCSPTAVRIFRTETAADIDRQISCLAPVSDCTPAAASRERGRTAPFRASAR